jgi:peptide-N4-(N-acetyl-beta-glucosaminyl)asparagine amidase
MMVLEMWVINRDTLLPKSQPPICTASLINSNKPCIQPVYSLIDTEFKLCRNCSTQISDGLIQVDDKYLKCFECDGNKLIDMGFLDSSQVCSESELQVAESVALFLLRHLFHMAISEQAKRIANSNRLAQAITEFTGRIELGLKTVMVYEDPLQQYSARNMIDYKRIHLYATEHIATHPSCAEDEAFLRGLLRWFKQDFFVWCNQPACCNPQCASGGSQMVGTSSRQANLVEVRDGWAQHIEVYRCQACNTTTDFPRYNNPSCLLTTRKGRCGEWANAFCLICRALCLDARYVLDFTDHVWVEVWLPSQRRFVHMDSCEQALDSPLLYEAGWGKKLTHVLSFSRYGVVDCSPKYTRLLAEVVIRRASVGPPESHIKHLIVTKDADVEAAYLRNIGRLSEASTGEFDGAMRLHNLLVGKSFYDQLFSSDLNEESIRDRKRLLSRELEGMCFLGPGDVKLDELRGRLSGDRIWRQLRGELGNETA